MPYTFIIGLGALLPVLYAFFRYWRRSHLKVNCWFCGLNNVILQKCRDGWMCKHCEQYNGFKSDGDYNRDIPAQWESSHHGGVTFCTSPKPYSKPSNGLCEDCNKNQEMKVAQLASFQPINPNNFDQEIENFSYHLERAYQLCPTCESVLEDTLSLKKTHILDMNLQLTGKLNQNRSFKEPRQLFKKSIAQTSTFMNITIAIAIAAFTISTFSSDHIFFKPMNFDRYVVHAHSKSYPLPSISIFIQSSPICLKEEVNTLPPSHTFSKILIKNFEPYLNLVGIHVVPLCIAGLTLKGLSSWHSGLRPSAFLWLAFAGTVFFHELKSEPDYLQLSQSLQVIFSLLIVAFSWQEMNSLKVKLSPQKKHKINSSKPYRKPEIIRPVAQPPLNATQLYAQPPSQRLLQPILRQETTPLESPSYLSLPSRSASVISSSRTLTSAESLNLSRTEDLHNVLSQEDNRSDASVDSAFSNPDSITLDGADSCYGSQPSISSKKKTSQDGDVQSLIETLSIGSAKGRQNHRASSEIKAKMYVPEKKRSSLLCPPKLTNIMNESRRSGIWKNTGNNSTLNSSFVSAEKDIMNESRRSGIWKNTGNNSSLNSSFVSAEKADPVNESFTRSVSPSGSVHSQATIRSGIESVRSFSPPSSFQPVAPQWNFSSPQNMLSVCVPHNPLVANSGFGNMASPVASSPISQVIYTPYGMYHQMVNQFGSPGMFMIPPQSPVFTNRSPNSSYGSQFSPRSFSTSSRFCDSDHDADFSPKSTKGKLKTKSALSTSFLESVWQSRYAIIYTTLCYLLLGSVVCVFSYSGLATTTISKVLNWKESLMSSIS
ncbi:hypothetical protein FOCC_FOCC014501 [Frankliniella occidentalis]|uniref:Uncharacterized protein LOC113218267 n=1 Tax=Frankliniella occidentalis TaxID=133901 RepID=A0A6J1TNE9_FRAOC|nr:uncharacterized protein LOC113218267 [Frankliniella occidentalis]KAE8739985.1 hypothetical protein FOCC_FOCC014501 [Frankliniella occidentalis]